MTIMLNKISFFTLLIIVCCIPGFGQEQLHHNDSLFLMLKSGSYKPLTFADSVYASNLPEFQLPELYKTTKAPTLPPVVDNSQLPFHRPVFQQGGYSCGQSALVGYNFTYEMNFVRDANGDETDNQYPTHFVWNWMNAGNNYGGVSYYHTMEVLRKVGTPNVTQYGGMQAGGETRWMTGYDLYYQAMRNRIENAYNIRTDTYEGFQTLKYWLFDHANGSEAGGFASFYANQPGTQYLPAGTPEAGKHVCIGWASYSSHALTIVGYNDSIRWDYNNDGKYTNTIDINGDGIINVKDWEIGGFKFVNSYGGVPGWADSGYCYMMYKTVADQFGEGGIWNNTVNILKTKKSCSPQLTFKASVTHTNRSRIKIKAGIALDTTAIEPEYVIDFPVFDYQGGNFYMQGGSSEEDKTLELGLDITPLINHFPPQTPVRFFFIIDEYDPGNSYDGQINYVTLMDYSSGAHEIPCADSNINIVSNGQSLVSIVAGINYEDVDILTASLPEALLYEPYEYQLECEGGSAPYRWEFDMDYGEMVQSQAFPTVDAEQLVPSNNDDGYALKTIDFDFPFYGEKYDSIYVYVDGFLKFDNFLVTWPYHQDKYIRWLKNRSISPFFDVDLKVYTSQGDGLWYEGDENSATFRWKVSQNGQASTSELNLAVKLYSSGDIEFYYNDMLLHHQTTWFAGVSNGDGKFYKQSQISGQPSIPDMHKIAFIPVAAPKGLSITEDGLITGIPEDEYDNQPVPIKVSDNNNISSSTVLQFNTTGILSSFQVTAGGDDIIERGDTVNLTVTLKNETSDVIDNAMMFISSNDIFIELSDTTEYVGSINPNEIKVFGNAFSFIVSDSISNGHTIHFTHQLETPADTFNRNISFNAFTAQLSIQNIYVDDGGNNKLDPGEVADIIIEIQNSGGGKATGLVSELSSLDPLISVISGNDNIDFLPGNTTKSLEFTVDVSEMATSGHIAYFDIDIEAQQNITIVDSIFLTVGTILEDFETGDFSKFPWYSTGHTSWGIDSINVLEGNYSAASGDINDAQRSTFHLGGVVLSNSQIRFYRRVSSEPGYDFLIFSISESEMNRWAGELNWEQMSYDVKKGFREFRWEYRKDANVLNGADKAWIDYVELPPMQSQLLKVYAGTDDTICASSYCQLNGTSFNADSVKWSTLGDGLFSDNMTHNTDYTPGPNDITNGFAVLTFTGYHSKGEALADSVLITLNPLPEIILEDFPILCYWTPPYLLTEGSPQGGEYSGTGVWNGYFHSETAGLGYHAITYTYEDEFGCINSETKDIYVDPCTGINDIDLNDKVRVVPNPNNGFFSLLFQESSGQQVVSKIYTHTGVLVDQKEAYLNKGNKEIEFNLNLAPGVYFIEIKTGENRVVKKLVINR